MANLNLITIFLTVAETKNITKAAEKLFISQPAISAGIKKFEEEVGGLVFIRQNKGVKLTNEGEHIYNSLKSSINDIQSTYDYFNRVKQLDSGILKIGTTTSNVTKLLNSFIKRFVEIFNGVEIKIVRGKEQSLIKKLISHDLDLLIIDDEYVLPSVKIIKEFEVSYSIVGNKDYFLKYKNTPMTKEDFTKETLAMINSTHTSRININSYFENYGLKINPKYEFENYGIIMDFIKSGHAIGVANLEYFENELNNNSIYKINTDFEIDKRKIVAVKSKEEYYNPAKDEFLKLIEGR